MEHFLTNVLLAIGIVATPTPTANWQPFGISTEIYVELDANSMKVEYNQGWEIYSKVKITFAEEFPIKGKKKKGKYYIDEVTAVCHTNSLKVGSVVAYAKDGEALATETGGATIPNPRETGNFVTEYISAMCNTMRQFKPPITT